VDGAYAAYLEFEDGTPATIVYSGYAHFDSAELHHWMGERGLPRDPETNGRSRQAFEAREPGSAADEPELRDARRYGGAQDRGQAAAASEHHQFFGLMLFSFERADVRQSPDGLIVYDDEGRHEIKLPTEPSGADAMIDELCSAVETGTPPPHDGRWGAATLEVCEAILQSSCERREILLREQVPYRG